MAIQTRTITIGEHSYTVTQLPAMRSMRLQMRLGKALGATLPRLVGAISGTVGVLLTGDNDPLAALLDSDLSKVDFGALGDALRGLFAELDPDTFETITRELLSTTVVDGKEQMSPAVYDAVFTGADDEAWRLIAFAMEVQYGDFFGRLFGRSKQKLAALRSRESSTSSATGPSFASS